MAVVKKKKERKEFGDFQTPVELARQVCGLLQRNGVRPASLIEPTCGTGNFLVAALEEFPDVNKAICLEINSQHLGKAVSASVDAGHADKVEAIRGDFFRTNWPKLLHSLSEPILIIGNPPWVTNSELGSLNSSNLPEKTNHQKHSGLEAITGKSNFDICEWMLSRLINALDGRNATIAMLCKTAVARRVLEHAWRLGVNLDSSAIYSIDATKYFGASVEAGLLVCSLRPGRQNRKCLVYESMSTDVNSKVFMYQDGNIIADAHAYNRWRHLEGNVVFPWRSGIKHDCAKVMELTKIGKHYENGFGEIIDIENVYVYPLLKGSDLINGATESPERWLIVTQKAAGDDTDIIRHRAPKTWQYLLSKAEYLDGRLSRVYRKRPRFAIFGIGEYSFSPWKVAIAGFQKQIFFRVIGDFRGKPIVLDDTSYFLPCRDREEVEYMASLLNSEISKEFFEAFVFWDAKRPITSHLLQRLDLLSLAREMESEDTMLRFMSSPAEKSGMLFQSCK